MSKKPIIVFEGIEGSGKTSHIKNVEKYLKKNNKKFIKINMLNFYLLIVFQISLLNPDSTATMILCTIG